MGQFKPLPLAGESHLFLVGQSSRGFWVARDLEGSEGIFRNQKEAVRFALSEGGHPNAVLISPNGVEPSYGLGIR
ncbi:hypothetical protein [Bosea sp. CS1GBMeth4]|uniref:hypothetical protein n=1 Tax=Bosea sp. CS1GBMeth4 TaxID=1892849 RepID=UPI0016441C33|nr:hypothetical protein [Bosea sp. CS1GBMeth4]